MCHRRTTFPWYSMNRFIQPFCPDEENGIPTYSKWIPNISTKEAKGAKELSWQHTLEEVKGAKELSWQHTLEKAKGTL